MTTDPAGQLGERLVELGLLGPSRMQEHLAVYRGEAPDADFAAWLHKRGVLDDAGLRRLDLEQLPPSSDGALEREGEVFSGCVIECKLGEGGMGTVYRARREGTGEGVVLKFLTREKASRADVRQRFRREGEVLVKLAGHPNVVDVYEVAAEGAEPHIVMEYVEGVSLGEVLKEHWNLRVDRALRIARGVLRGLVAVHQEGIIHRDLKPANLLLDRANKEVKIVDFGLAKDVAATQITRPGQVLGTPYYMAPEQWGDFQVDARCDLWAVGATLYHMLVGEPPFTGRTQREVAERILAGAYAPIRSVNQEASEEVELFCAQLLMSERGYRYPTAASALEDLERLQRGKRVRIPSLTMVTEGMGRRRYPLLPGLEFGVGRVEENDVVVPHSSVSRQHARVRRGPQGFTVRDLGSSFGTFVAGGRVDCAALHSGDALRLGKVTLEFQDGPGWDRSDTQAAPPRLRVVPQVVFEVLWGQRDPRTLLTAVEWLALEPLLERVQLELEALYGLRLAEDVEQEVKELGRVRRGEALRVLGSVSREALGDTLEAWLTWWDRAQGTFPVQLVPERVLRPRTLRVEAEAPPLEAALDGVFFAIGREETNFMSLAHRSVSRIHASLRRLNRVWVIHDEGSRFGTKVQGRPVTWSVLRAGDLIELGSVELRFDFDHSVVERRRPPRAGLAAYWVTPGVFELLERRRHPGVAMGLLELLHEARDPRWTLGRLRQHVEESEGAALEVAVREALEARAVRAREALTEMLGPGDLGRWSQQLAETRSGLPAQVLPMGCVPGHGSGKKASGSRGRL